MIDLRRGRSLFFHYGISPHCAKNSWGRRLSPKVKAMHGKGSCWDEQRLATTGFWTVSVGQFYPPLPPPQLALSASSSKTYSLLHVGNYSTNSFTDHKFSNKQIKVWNIRDSIINLVLLSVSNLLKSFQENWDSRFFLSSKVELILEILWNKYSENYG